MYPRLTVVTLGVTDLATPRRFAVDALGWHPVLDAGEAVFIQVAEPARAGRGGVTACVADPDGFRRETVCNPGPVVGADGAVRTGPAG